MNPRKTFDRGTIERVTFIFELTSYVPHNEWVKMYGNKIEEYLFTRNAHLRDKIDIVHNLPVGLKI